MTATLTGSPTFQNGAHGSDHALFGGVCHPCRLILAMIKSCIRFEDCSITRSKDKEDHPKFVTRGGMGWLGSLKVTGKVAMSSFDRAHATSYLSP